LREHGLGIALASRSLAVRVLRVKAALTEYEEARDATAAALEAAQEALRGVC
jgi:hypothetical protein